MKKYLNEWNTPTFAGFLALCVLFLNAGVSPVSAATLSRSVDVNGIPAKVWSVIGPFCAIKDWLPPVGECTEDGKSPPTRILVTKDGKAKFVETQTARNDANIPIPIISNRPRCRLRNTFQRSRL